MTSLWQAPDGTLQMKLFVRKFSVKWFWSRVDIKGPDDCWLWSGSYVDFGYGYFRVKRKGKWMRRFSHRTAWKLHNKKKYVRKGFMICHHCDNPPCCNPRHLYEGTQKENMQDMLRRGRNRMAKLTEQDVREIRAMKETCEEIGKKFGITLANVAYIRRRDTWKHVM